MPGTVLRGATTVHGAVIDVRIAEGLVAAAGPDVEALDDDEVIDLEGWLLTSSAVEPHAHLDKAFLAERIDNPKGDLLGAIEAMVSNRHLITVDDTVERAERAARLMAANGFTAVRTHADTTTDNGLASIEALVEVRRRVADVIDVEIVALTGRPVTGADGAAHRTLLREALDAGADLVGGCPHLDTGSSIDATDVFLEVAADTGRAVDLHTDETLDPTADGLAELAERVLEGFPHRVTASHCVSLGTKDSADQQRIAELVAEAGISVVALPHTNLFLQGRGHSPMPRGLTAVPVLHEAGTNVAAGADNLQDPFNPVGRACPFETAGLMIMAAHDLPATAWERVTAAPRRAMGRAPVTLRVGDVADLLAVRAPSIRSAIADAPAERMVWKAGVRTR